ncbi:glutathione S-transferase theta-1-like isoform X2 [Penaeus chinensis]|uniref:glutathione S-transferase theta-1-like isoform X2 n=1 Tax=Penaeus chinensis TaxID=139456 RepID=UPI001FB7A403|nr:glutathione S-transferase theta-1-like isoform X2 [Penaeus chinensis]
MLKLYFDLLSQPSRAAYIFLKKAKIPFQPQPVALRKGEHKTEEYAAINPFQLVPAIDDNGFKLIHSVAILRYLCREHKADHWYPSDSKAQARVDEYLEWQHVNTRMQCAMFFQHKFLRPKMLGMPVNEKKVAEFQERMEIVLDQLETIWLKDHPFIAGDHVTIADLVAACELEQPSMAGYDVCKGRPNLTAWFKRVRDSFQPHYDEAHMMVYRVKDKFGGNPAKSNL